MKNSLLALSLSIFFAACGPAEESLTDGNSGISGKLSNRNGDSIYLADLNGTKPERLASSFVDPEGNFSFTLDIQEPGYYRIETDERNFAVFILSPGDKAVLNADMGNLGYTYQVEGSAETKLFLDINKYSTELARKKSAIGNKKDSIIRTYQFLVGKNNTQKYIDSLDKAMEPEFNKLDAQLTPMIAEGVEKAKSFIDAHPGALANLAAIGLLNNETDFPEFVKVYDQFKAKYPDSKNLRGFYGWIESKQKLAHGSEAPDFTVQDPNGNPILLSQFRGKITLVDFWASWCGPCRKENPNVVKLYQKYKDKGFEIFGVSLDEKKENWLAAIAADGLTWKHGSELRGWNSSFCQLYNVQSIPFTMLLDKDGKILAMNLRGAMLEQKLEQLFNNPQP